MSPDGTDSDRIARRAAEIEAEMAKYVPTPAAPIQPKLAPVVALVDPDVSTRMSATSPSPICTLCKMPVNTSSDIRATNSARWVHKTCLDLRRESHRQSLRFDAGLTKGLGPLRHSLPRSRNDDDASMLNEAHDRLRRWHTGWSCDSKLSLLVVGLSASCKTLSIAATLRSAIARAIDDYVEHDGKSADLDWISRAFFIRAFDLAEAEREHKLGQGKCPEVLSAREATLLVLDDLGNENVGNEKLLLNVIDHRIGNGLPTWVTSGFSVDQLSERYGQALVRRLCEKGVGTLIDLFRTGAALKAVR